MTDFDVNEDAFYAAIAELDEEEDNVIVDPSLEKEFAHARPTAPEFFAHAGSPTLLQPPVPLSPPRGMGAGEGRLNRRESERVMSAHTPGPWFISSMQSIKGDREWVTFVQKGGWDICEMHGDYPEFQANVRLIAAAPDLLKALKALADDFTVTDCAGETRSADILAEALAAIAKAEGREALCGKKDCTFEADHDGPCEKTLARDY